MILGLILFYSILLVLGISIFMITLDLESLNAIGLNFYIILIIASILGYFIILSDIYVYIKEKRGYNHNNE